MGGDGIAVGPAGVGSEVEGVGFAVGRDVPGFGNAGKRGQRLGVVGGEPFPEGHGHADVVHPRHAAGVEGFDFIADAEGNGFVG